MECSHQQLTKENILNLTEWKIQLIVFFKFKNMNDILNT